MSPLLNGNQSSNLDHLGHSADDQEMSHEDAIAIVGIACRFPQDAENSEKLWEMLLKGRSAATEFPKNKMNVDAHYHPDPAHGGSMSCREAHLMKHNGSEFDAPFFSITKTEALSMDPQQRILMENVYEALENAGMLMDSVIGSETSVFVGAFTNDYQNILNTDPEMIMKYAPTGNSSSILSSRVSWFYDLKGCSLTLDTACSSSLVAFHLACQNLKENGAKMAIVNGTNIIEYPQTMFRMSNIGFLSPDGRCYSFDHRANGYSRGEGTGTIIIKRLKDALEDGNTIRAIVRGTGVNQDGRTPGITLPSKSAQENLIRSVYKNAGLDLSTTSYVEAHGTGTLAGDPVEAGAIAAAWSGRKSDTPLYIGAIKSNIGHLEGASGVAGLIKAVQVLEKAIIPPNINFEKVNPKIPLERWNLEFPVHPIPWPDTLVRRASVNSFGFGGTNAHVILDDARSFFLTHNLQGLHRTVSESPDASDLESREPKLHEGAVVLNGTPKANGYANELTSNSDSGADHEANDLSLPKSHPAKRLFILSSFDEAGINRSVEAFSKYLSSKSPVDEEDYINDLAHTLASKRTMFPWKGFIVAGSLQELIKRLPDAAKTSKHTRKGKASKLGFVFTGQGAQWYAMGRELLVYPVFRKSLEDATAYLDHLNSPWHLLDELLKGKADSKIDTPSLSQAACTALQVALVDLLASWNIFPSRVIGHSSGEIGAAYSVGALTRESAWKIAYYRGVVSAKLIHSKGAMMAVMLDQNSLLPYLQTVDMELDGELTMACFNSPKNITISGDEKKVDRLQELLKDDGIFARKLKVQNAYHSSHMRTVAGEYLELLGDLGGAPIDQEQNGFRGNNPDVVMFSTVNCLSVSLDQLRDPQYWISNMISPVRFVQGLTEMCSAPTGGRARLRVDGGADIPFLHLLEIGPHPALTSAIKETLSLDQRMSAVGHSHLVSRNNSSLELSLQTAGRLFCTGYPVDLVAVNRSSVGTNDSNVSHPQMLVDLPPYSFNHAQSYWPESRLSKNFRFRKFPRHDLLGAPVLDWNAQDPKWRHIIRVSENPWLKDHKVTGRIVYPGVGYVIMAVEAVTQLAPMDAKITSYRLRDISIRSALTIPEQEGGVETTLIMRPVSESSLTSSSTWREFKVLSYNQSSDDWTEHCRGLIKLEYDLDTGPIDAGREAMSESQNFHDQFMEVLGRCNTPVDMLRSYYELETIGLSFGPLFKNLTNVMRGTGTGNALGDVRVPDVRAAMPKKFTHPHIIHPATMDSMLHIFLAAIQALGGGARLNEPMVPVFMKEVLLAGDISNEPGHLFHTYGTASKTGHHKFEASITAWDAPTETPKVLFKGIQVTPLQSTSSTAGKRQLNYNLVWRPDLDLIDPSQIEPYIRENASPLTINEDETFRLAQDFNLAVIAYTLDALKAIKDVTLEDLHPHHERYLEWLHLQEERFKDGLILHQKPEWESIINDPIPKQKLFTRVINSGPEGALTSRIGSNLVGILRKEVDALQLMFGDELLDSYYRELHGTESLHHLLHPYLEMYTHKNVNLKILEIGAGTGGTTLPILETLCPSDQHSNVTSYTYTDISPGFFEKAKAKFKNWRHVLEFKRLDIEKDPLAQGFEEGHYDIIIAANVLHATADLNKTLNNARSLLRPNGKLVLQEGAATGLLSGPLAFGTLPGWWLSVEPSRRWGPLLTAPEWNDMLLKSGFSGTDLVLKDYLNENIHAQSLMVTTVPSLVSIQEVQETIIVISSSDALDLFAASVQKSMQRLGLLDLSVVNYTDLEGRDLKQTVCIALLELERSVFVDGEKNFTIMKHLLTTCAGVIWVTGDPMSSPDVSISTGLIRTIRWERDLDDLNLVTLGLEFKTQQLATSAAQIAKVYEYQFLQQNNQRNAEYCSFGGIIHANRLVSADYVDEFLFSRVSKPRAQLLAFGGDPSRALKLTTAAPGLLHELQFVDCPKYETDLAADDVEVKIEATGLNFRDVMSAMGEVGGDVLGAEGAGIVTRIGADVKNVNVADRVVLLASLTGCFSTFARTKEACVAGIPDEITFEKAAGMPVIYCTALYCLVDIARLQRGESILIHAATGGVGQAAITLAQNIGAEIFATISSEEKKKILMDTYKIPEDHILSSRDLSFAKGVMRLTNGRGVDVILNSLAGEALRVTWECIAPFGRFIEIGKRDIYSNGRLEMFPFSRNVTFASVDLETVMRLDPGTISRLLHRTMSMWEKNLIRETTPFNVFDYSQIEASFRLIQSGKHIGKVVLTAGKHDPVRIVPKPQTPYRFPEDATYVLAGGLGGLGRSMARWMVSRGARNLVFLSRNGASTEASQKLVKELREEGCVVDVKACDVGDKAALEKVLSESQKSMPPIKGCIQGAMQLKDSAFENMIWENFQAAILPKVNGSWNLHEALPKDMDFFIMLSSICGIIGNRGQGNYAAGNVYQDTLAHYRQRKGLPATALDLGTMLSVGFIAENQDRVGVNAFAIDAIREDEFHALLEYHIDPRNLTQTPLRCQVAVGLATRSVFQRKGIPEPSFMRDPLFTQLRATSERADSDGDEDSFVAMRDAIRSAKTLEDATALIVEALIKRISGIVTLPIEDIDSGKPIHFYGVDSLVAVEFRNWLSKNLQADIEVLDIMSNDSIAELSKKIAKASKMLSFGDKKAEGNPLE
ncbi:hypothetical protein BDZ45DRAFT_184816 [Acephala macrosclerotiorum]|nr:hypothetical protein BDZ45DRAFT_184816 [Acephala macrosclerotiorum]